MRQPLDNINATIINMQVIRYVATGLFLMWMSWSGFPWIVEIVKAAR